MKIWTEWVDSPQHIWLRRAIFQIHLWSGIGLGLYVVVISLSGSAAVFNRELYTAFLPPPRIVNMAGTRMTRAELKSAAQKAHPGATISRVALPADPQYAATITLGLGVNADQRLFDPYTGLDIGNARPFGLRMVSFFSQLHMNLLMDYTGRLVNGVGGFLVTALTLTGMIIWWPGIGRWRDSLTVRWDTNLKRLNWSLHSAIGFWTSAIVLMWAVTGAYLVFPKPFNFLIDIARRSRDQPRPNPSLDSRGGLRRLARKSPLGRSRPRAPRAFRHRLHHVVAARRAALRSNANPPRGLDASGSFHPRAALRNRPRRPTLNLGLTLGAAPKAKAKTPGA